MKKKAYIVLTDLDGSFTPIVSEEMATFAKLMKSIQDKENVAVKFAPVSGRNADYLSAIMGIVKWEFDKVGVKDAIDYGAAEQGAVIQYANSPVARLSLAKPESKALIADIKCIFNESKFAKIMDYHPTNEYDMAFLLKSAVVKSWKQDKNGEKEHKEAIYKKFKDYMLQKIGNRADVVYSGCIEITPPEIGKDKAINWILSQYQKDYDIVGVTYYGDSENDKKAIEYMAKLAEIPGIKFKTYIPSDAKKEIESANVEGWKVNNKNVHSLPSVFRASPGNVRSRGLVELMEKDLKNETLLGRGTEHHQFRDDCQIKKQSLSEKLNAWATKDTMALSNKGLTMEI